MKKHEDIPTLFRVTYKDHPEWDEVFEAYSWMEAVRRIGCAATKLEVLERG